MRKRKLVISLGLTLSLMSLASCSSGEGGETILPQGDLKVTFEFDETHLSILEQDDLSKKVVGDNYKVKFKVEEGIKIEKVEANGEIVNSLGSNLYVFKLKEGENLVKVTSISTLKPFKKEEVKLNPNASSSQLFTNWGYPHFPTTGNQKLLVVPVTIKGHEKNATEENKKQIEKAFFGDSTNTYFESVSSFYKKSSYGKLNITGQVTNWYNCELTAAEIYNLRHDVYGDSGLFELTNRAINWVKTYESSINLKDYDNNKDGYIDGIYFVYSAFDALTEVPEDPNHAALLWNHTFYNINNVGKANKENPITMTYSWSSFNMMNRAAKDSIDAHTYIHEFGHQLGLDDYYDTSINGGATYTSPMGGLDMMDNNIGDHSMYSKFALGWTAPTSITGSNGTIEVELKPSYIDGDFLILAGDDYNGLPFDEYIAIEYLSNKDDENNLNYFDSINPYPVTSKTDGTKVATYKESGIRVTHIDARAINKENKLNDDVTKMVRTKFSNTASIKDGYRDPKTNNSYVLTTLISANKSRNVQGVIFTADSSDLFKEGDSFNFKAGEANNYSNCIPSLTNKLNDGSKMSYSIKIKSMTEEKAVLEISGLK